MERPTAHQRDRPHFAYYSDGIAWSSSEWAKTMLLFFDGIAMLVPQQEDEAFERSDESVIEGMRAADCLRVLRPSDLVDEVTAKQVVETVSNTIEGMDWRGSGLEGAVNLIYTEKLGSAAAPELFERMVTRLQERGLATDWQRGTSMAVDRRVYMLTMAVLAAHSRRRGELLGVRLTPATDDMKWSQRRHEIQHLRSSDKYT